MKKTFKIPIYTGKLLIIQSNNFKKLNKKYKIEVDINNYEAFAFTHKDNYVVVFKNEKVKRSIIAHEVVHLVNMIFLDHGILLDYNNDEPQAYLTGWLFNKCDKFLK